VEAESEVEAMADTATGLVPPGRAQITQCPDCHGSPGSDCPECDGTGKILYRACPRCGDIAWDYISDRQEMACRISCGCRWTADDPGWQIQRLP
jgi:hypothetical protein